MNNYQKGFIDLRGFSEPGELTPAERRQAPRYPLQLRMLIVAIDHKEVKISATSSNISRTGILFRGTAKFIAGQRIEYLIDLYPDCSLQLRCKGTISRWQRGYPGIPDADGMNTIAATLEHYECVQGFD